MPWSISSPITIITSRKPIFASDTYIEKDLSINEEIEKLRLRTTASLLSGRRDIVVVSSVSCLYGIGNPEDFHASSVKLTAGEAPGRKKILYALVDALYTRTEAELQSGTFRVNGEVIDVMSAYSDSVYRISMFDDEVEQIARIDPASGQVLERLDTVTIFPANMFVTTRERTNRAIQQIQLDLGERIRFFEEAGRMMEAQRIKQRVEYDLEMIKELGYCSGIENYSRYLDGRKEGTRPFCLLDYFPEDYLLVIDESHVTIPQIRRCTAATEPARRASWSTVSGSRRPRTTVPSPSASSKRWRVLPFT